MATFQGQISKAALAFDLSIEAVRDSENNEAIQMRQCRLTLQFLPLLTLVEK